MNALIRLLLLTAVVLMVHGSWSTADEAQHLPPRPTDHQLPGLDRDHHGRWRGPFFFVQLADTQFGMYDQDRSWQRETAQFELAIRHIHRLKPRFVVVCGDLVNQVPGGSMHGAQVKEFQRIARQVDPSIPLVCLCGNHDVGNRPTPELLAAYRHDFGDDWFRFWIGGVYCAALNSSLYSDPSGAPAEQEQQSSWLTRELGEARKAGAKHILLFQHHSWFLEKADEPDQYFNIPLVRRQPALSLLHQAGVRAVFAGHYHRNAYGKDGNMEMVTTGPVGKALGKDPSGLRIVKVYEDRIEHQYYGLDDVPEQVVLK